MYDFYLSILGELQFTNTHWRKSSTKTHTSSGGPPLSLPLFFFSPLFSSIEESSSRHPRAAEVD